MKIRCFMVGMALSTLVQLPLTAHATTTIDATNRYAFGANIGWMNWRGDTNNGAVIGEYVCSGSLYSANVGWISLGNGAPLNGIQYQNASTNDFGVNHDGFGNLRGYAYAANVGWINFETNGAPHVDLTTGKLSGAIYSANCGWISLSNGFAHVQTTTIPAGADTDGDGIADAWERQKFGNLITADATSDADTDTFTDRQEYLADTNPNDSGSYLFITDFDPGTDGTLPKLTWTSVLSRQYRIQKTLDLAPSLWTDSGLGLIPADGNTTARDFPDTNAPVRFYRVEAVRPLSQ
jgi:hypothetical protein